MAWTTADEVIAAWIGADAPADLALVARWVDKAERLIRSAVPGIDARIDGGAEPDLMANVVDVVIEMVTRKFRNPEGLRQVQETSGPFSGSRTYGGAEPGSLYIADDELQILAPTVPTGQRAFSVSMIPNGYQ